MTDSYRKRRLIITVISLVVFMIVILVNTPSQPTVKKVVESKSSVTTQSPAIDALAKLEIKGRAPKTNYTREQFGDGWQIVKGCDTRNIILNRDLSDASVDKACNVTSGRLSDPYTGKEINFVRGKDTSGSVQIDHVVALSDAWQKGAQYFSADRRVQLANDPLELLAVDGAANLQKSDGDAATWLPPNKSFRCQYVARQIAVKVKYAIWVTRAEYDAIEKILGTCPGQMLPSP